MHTLLSETLPAMIYFINVLADKGRHFISRMIMPVFEKIWLAICDEWELQFITYALLIEKMKRVEPQ